MKRFVYLGVFLLLLFSCSSASDKWYTAIAEADVYLLSVPVAEKVKSVLVDEGEEVSAGQTLVEMDKRGYELKLKEIEARRRSIESQRRELMLRLESAKETVAYLSQTYDRNLILLKQNAVSPQKVDELKNQLTVKKNELAALEAGLDGLAAQVEAMDASIESVKLTLSRLSVVSPVDGLVEDVFYKTGEFAAPMSPVAEVIDLGKIRAKVYVDELMLARIKPSQTVSVKTAVSQLPGRVVKLPQKAEFSPREVRTPENRRSLVYAVEIEVDNPDYVIKAGMPVEVHF